MTDTTNPGDFTDGRSPEDGGPPRDPQVFHPNVQHLLDQFEYGHLPEGPIQTSSAIMAGIAHNMASNLGSGPELSAGLRHLLEAKDCFVRQAVADVKKQRLGR